MKGSLGNEVRKRAMVTVERNALAEVVATLTADNERLRAALTEISGHGCYRINATAGPVGDALDHLSECVNIACAALAPRETL